MFYGVKKSFKKVVFRNSGGPTVSRARFRILIPLKILQTPGTPHLPLLPQRFSQHSVSKEASAVVVAIMEATIARKLYGRPSLPCKHSQLLLQCCNAISNSLTDMRTKELVVALEWSKNDAILEGVLKRAEQEAGSECLTVIDRG